MTRVRIVHRPPRSVGPVITGPGELRDLRRRRRTGRKAAVLFAIEPTGSAYVVRLYNAARVEVGTLDASDLAEARRLAAEATGRKGL